MFLKFDFTRLDLRESGEVGLAKRHSRSYHRNPKRTVPAIQLLVVGAEQATRSEAGAIALGDVSIPHRVSMIDSNLKLCSSWTETNKAFYA
jgi:hypothetical protein